MAPIHLIPTCTMNLLPHFCSSNVELKLPPFGQFQFRPIIQSSVGLESIESITVFSFAYFIRVLLDLYTSRAYNQDDLINIINQINTIMKPAKSALLAYLAKTVNEEKSIPSIAQLAKVLGLSNAAVREQLEVARQLQLVEVKTKTGIQVSSFSISPAICLASKFGIEINPEMIWDLLSVRQHLELAYWQEAVVRLNSEDVELLGNIVESAMAKIGKRPLVAPVQEHRDFHLAIYRPLNNVYLNGILESYWDLFHDSEIRLYNDQTSLENVWNYHQKIYQAIVSKQYEVGYQALVTHFEIVRSNSKATLKQRFE